MADYSGKSLKIGSVYLIKPKEGQLPTVQLHPTLGLFNEGPLNNRLILILEKVTETFGYGVSLTPRSFFKIMSDTGSIGFIHWTSALDEFFDYVPYD